MTSTFAPLCFVWNEGVVVENILHQPGYNWPQVSLPKKPPTSPLADLCFHIFPLTHTFLPCSDNLDTIFFSLLSSGYVSFFSLKQRSVFLKWSIWPLFQGSFILVAAAGSWVSSVHQRPLCSSSTGLLWGTGHTDCTYRASNHMYSSALAGSDVFQICCPRTTSSKTAMT